ncbi:DUF484 family protein [Acidovorax sp. SRB_24]|uniref:DUF484 family protein n=1 Tax=Acidovorax sp. SRB_24 TaxID=1962700 RepID=UPI00145EA65A|nr:DUF484 family protein [Acidovorax sp. SRB_24]NMM75919.1 hypothetical protein [Acidovorax sp. SRB_24]
MNSSQLPPITEEDIVEFLAHTPGFFERHAEVLASVQFTSPHSHRAVSLQERQAEMLREKIKVLEQRVMEMVRNSNENAAIAQKVHEWSCALQRVTAPADLPDAVVQGMLQQFDVPQAAIRVWDVAAPYAHAAFAQGVGGDVRAFATSLTMPFCGPNLGFEPAGWLPGGGLAHADGSGAQSLALLPLRKGPANSATPAFGLLVLASHDPQRFDATMGTDFLSRMAELASAALARLR